MKPRAPGLRLAVPVLACRDLEAVMRFYVERLGFTRQWTWGDPPMDGGVKRGDVQIFFMTNAALAERAADCEVMVFVEDVDALYEEHVALGAPISAPIVDEPWGLREYTVKDPHGYLLRFAESTEALEARRPASPSDGPAPTTN